MREVGEFLFPAETQSRREEELEVIFCCFSERDKLVYETVYPKEDEHLSSQPEK